jgi:spore coat polysaccharide biosynthesis predicted glycosyltransferase SpsG
VIRADASAAIGAGHVMRSSAIAEELINREYGVVLVANIENLAWVEEYLGNVGYQCIVTSEKFSKFVSKENILILDSYSISQMNPNIQKEKWKSVVVMADPVTPDYKYDLLIHPGIDSSWLENNNNTLSGSKYIPFRKSLNQRRGPLKNDVLHIVVVGGGTNVHNFSQDICNSLLQIDFPFKASVFTNSGKISGYDNRFTFFEPSGLLDSIALTADLILTTASTTSLEFIARQIPIGILCAVNNQISYYEALTSKRIAAPLGHYSKGFFNVNQGLLQDLVTSQTARLSYADYSGLSIDFNGSKRIVDMLIKLTN